MKKIISVLLVLVCLLSIVGCGKNKVLTQDEAIAVALKAANLDDYDDAHAHVTEENGVPCYNIHISAGDVTYNYLIAAKGGEILASGQE